MPCVVETQHSTLLSTLWWEHHAVKLWSELIGRWMVEYFNLSYFAKKNELYKAVRDIHQKTFNDNYSKRWSHKVLIHLGEYIQDTTALLSSLLFVSQ